MIDRRSMLQQTGAAFAALLTSRNAAVAAGDWAGYGPLMEDPGALLDLPQGFSYRIISQLGDAMDDGLTVPDKADGMGCFELADGRLALVRNHELEPGEDGGGELMPGYDFDNDGTVLPGGTTTLVLNPHTLDVEEQFRSLSGTIRNCAGGTTPWGSWLSCEEKVESAGIKVGREHGWVFEVPAARQGLADPMPLTAMGRFRHEACCVDPSNSYIYMTEDRDDGLFYRFIPAMPGQLRYGGRLQALAMGEGMFDTRNWDDIRVGVGESIPARWIDCDNVESPDDDLRNRGANAGAAIFARGEGLHMGEGELYFCCTSGGNAKVGQVFRLRIGGDAADRLELFFESRSPREFSYGDNLTIAPNGHLIVCEDQGSDPVDNHLRGIATDGVAYPLARLRTQTEVAGACFSPDGRTLFLNIFSPAKTVAISGPWNG